MKTVYVTQEIKTLYNGNVAIVDYCPYVKNSPGLQVTKGKKCNGEKVDIVINPTEESILLKSSYNTTSNGRCDDLIIGPREGLYLIDKGSGYRFAAYRLVKYW